MTRIRNKSKKKSKGEPYAVRPSVSGCASMDVEAEGTVSDSAKDRRAKEIDALKAGCFWRKGKPPPLSEGYLKIPLGAEPLLSSSGWQDKTSNSLAGTVGPDEKPICECGISCSEVTAGPAAQNPGRTFFSCGRNRNCNFLKWKDDWEGPLVPHAASAAEAAQRWDGAIP